MAGSHTFPRTLEACLHRLEGYVSSSRRSKQGLHSSARLLVAVAYLRASLKKCVERCSTMVEKRRCQNAERNDWIRDQTTAGLARALALDPCVCSVRHIKKHYVTSSPHVRPSVPPSSRKLNFPSFSFKIHAFAIVSTVHEFCTSRRKDTLGRDRPC
jgi:hypothetical protein